ncbi:MAG: prephenate dehydrogenase [Ruminococcaceae bacterium]|nr:prephenate dehydrogenase [Oscillospiraceae bacterium]
MNVGIVGLGLIGGSMAKAYRAYSNEHGLDFKIYGSNRSRSIVDFAMLDGTLDGVLDEITIPMCDVIFVSLYPVASIEYLKKNSYLIAKHTTVIDLCGTKRDICNVGFELAEQYGYTFVGGHPMAGTHHSGYKYSKATMFRGAPMVIVPKSFDDIAPLEHIKQLLSPAGFGKYSYTTAEQHDKMIAFTSQLAHVVSNAYVKSPTAKNHKGFSAGSYKDMTRVAWLNEVMWAELFLENREPLLFEIDNIIASLSEYRDALRSEDKQRLTELLRDGRIAKEEIDG